MKTRFIRLNKIKGGVVLILMQRLRKVNHCCLIDMDRGGQKYPKKATEMFRESIHPYDSLYEFYQAGKDADIIILCKDKWGREITFMTGTFANKLNDNTLKSNKSKKV